MNIAPESESILRRVTTARNSERDAKRDALERAKAIVAAEVEGYELATDMEVRRAYEAGIPNARIGAALGTSDARTVTNRLARTAQLMDVRQSEDDPLADPRYSIDPDGVLMVTLSGDELTRECVQEGWTVAEAIHAGVNTATFNVGQYVAIPFEPGYLPEHKRKHPVVAWAARDANDESIRAFYEGRKAS